MDYIIKLYIELSILYIVAYVLYSYYILGTYKSLLYTIHAYLTCIA